jgi:hypothetical protein
LLAAALGLALVPAAAGSAALRVECIPLNATTCKAVIAVDAADNGAQVEVVTPRPSLGGTVSVNPPNLELMENVASTPDGMDFTIANGTTAPAGSAITIIFRLGANAQTGFSSPSATSSLSLRGPAANTLGAHFSYALSGHAESAAVLVAFEPAGGACAARASAYPVSSARVDQPIPAGHSFAASFHLVARVRGLHALCAYLLDAASKATLARAAAHWTNRS